MSDTLDWKGRRIGPYQIGEPYQDIPEDLGLLYEAHHVETGEPALVVIPGPGDDWRIRTPWSVRTTNFTQPNALVLHLERPEQLKAPLLHELALGHIRMAGALAGLDEQEATKAHVTSGPPPPSPRHPTRPWGLAGVGLALAVGLTLMLWPRAPELPKKSGALEESVIFSDKPDTTFPLIAYPMPETPFKQQSRPPCDLEREVEVRGGCWILHTKTAPCPRGTAENQGKCYIPVRKPDPQPTSVQP
jgi:hypothetical protein